MPVDYIRLPEEPPAPALELAVVGGKSPCVTALLAAEVGKEGIAPAFELFAMSQRQCRRARKRGGKHERQYRHAAVLT